jgi:hypothetical protein
METPYLRDLEIPFTRRKSLSQINNNTTSNQSPHHHTNNPAIECGGYKPNAPQIQGK